MKEEKRATKPRDDKSFTMDDLISDLTAITKARFVRPKKKRKVNCKVCGRRNIFVDKEGPSGWELTALRGTHYQRDIEEGEYLFPVCYDCAYELMRQKTVHNHGGKAYGDAVADACKAGIRPLGSCLGLQGD